MPSRLGAKLFIGAAALLVAGLVAGGLSLIRSPDEMRAFKEDSSRLSHVKSLHYRVNAFYKNRGALPESLSSLETSSPVPTDPFRGVPCAYRVIDAETYQLCADFNLSTMDDTPTFRSLDWRHEAGEYCFTLTVPARRDAD